MFPLAIPDTPSDYSCYSLININIQDYIFLYEGNSNLSARFDNVAILIRFK